MLIKNGDLPVTPITADKLHESTCGHGYWERSSMGLTKREYFAAMAMQGMLNGMMCNADGRHLMLISEKSVKAADALLAELEKNK